MEKPVSSTLHGREQGIPQTFATPGHPFGCEPGVGLCHISLAPEPENRGRRRLPDTICHLPETVWSPDEDKR